MLRRWMRTLALPLLLAAACDDNAFPDDPLGAGGAGEGSLRGSVLSAGGGVGGVAIILIDVDSTLTAADGTYAFTELVPGAYNVQIRVPLGFRLATGDDDLREVTVPDGGAANADWTLVQE